MNGAVLSARGVGETKRVLEEECQRDDEKGVDSETGTLDEKFRHPHQWIPYLPISICLWFAKDYQGRERDSELRGGRFRWKRISFCKLSETIPSQGVRGENGGRKKPVLKDV